MRGRKPAPAAFFSVLLDQPDPGRVQVVCRRIPGRKVGDPVNSIIGEDVETAVARIVEDLVQQNRLLPNSVRMLDAKTTTQIASKSRWSKYRKNMENQQ